MGGSTNNNNLDKEDQTTREVYRRCLSEDVSRVEIQDVSETTVVEKSEISGQESAQTLVRDSKVHITDGGVSTGDGSKSCTTGDRLIDNESWWKNPVI